MKSITLTAIDIGTSSVKGLCVKKDLRTGDIDILAKEQCPCFGVRSGEVVKPEQVLKALVKVKEEISKKAGLKIKDVLVNIGGRHLFSMPSQGLISVSRADQKISKEDVQRVLKAAQTVNLPSNKEILDVFPQEFIIDGEGGIKEPLGLQGIRLEAKVLLACVFSPILENLEQVLLSAELEELDVVPSAMAASQAVLTQEQKELGVLSVDIGAGTTSMAVFEKGDLIDFAVFPIGTANITNDIAIGLRAEIQTAERIKKEFASLSSEVKKRKGAVRPVRSGASNGARSATKEKVEIPEKSLIFSRRFLKKIVESRVSEMFTEVQRTLKKISGGEPLPAGVVLTGGGSLLPGIVEFAKQKFKLPCRLGSLRAFPGAEEPQFSVCVGLVLGGFQRVEGEEEGAMGEGVKEKVKKLFKAFLP